MNEYLDLLKAAPAAGTGTPDNPYLGMLEKVEDERKARLSATLVTTAGANPDEFAKQRQTAAYLGLPTAAVEAQPDIAQQQARIKQVAQDTANSPTLQRKYSEADFAKLAHDDSGVLSSLAAAAKYVFSHPDSKNTLAGDLGAGLYYRSSAALAGGFRAVAELPAPLLDPLVGRVLPANPLRVVAEGFAKIGRESTAKANAISPPAEGIVAGGVTSGFQSLGQNSKYLPLALFGPAGAAAALTGMSAEAGGQSYQDAREKGLTAAQALPFATSQAIIEYGTEKLPLGKLLEGVNAGAPIWKTIAKTAAAEVPGEQLATVLQDMNEWAVLPENKDKPFSEYLAERPSAAAQTLIATLIGAGGNVVIADTARTAIDRMLDIQRGAQQGEATGQNLQQLFALAAQSRLRERAPDTFQGLVQELADEPGGVPAEVRFDARTLVGEDGTGGVLNQEQLAAIPSIQAQIGEALATGGEVVVPIGELMQLADSGVEKALIEHARVGANELSQAEAKMAAEQAEQFLQQEAQRVIETARNVQDMQARAETVMQTVLDQLNTASRFTADVNRAYATLVRDFYVTMAERLGITPDELYARYPLQVVAKATTGEALNEPGMRPGAMSVEAYHYSKEARSVISTGAFGTGLEGSARDQYLNAADQRLRKRSYFYVDKGTGINPEAGVGGIAHRVKLDNVYDANSDPLRLRRGGQMAFESALLDRGYSGYLDRLEGTQSGQVVMLGDQTFKPEILGPMGKTTGTVVSPPVERASRGRDQVVDRMRANKSLPGGAMALEKWDRLLAALMPLEHRAMQDAGVFDGDRQETLYKDELVRKFEDLTPAEEYAQKAQLQGKSIPTSIDEVAGVASAFAFASTRAFDTNRDFKQALQDRVLAAAKAAKVKLSEFTRGTEDYLVRVALVDARVALQTNANAIGWYNGTTTKALRLAALVHPEISTDPRAKFAFVWALAVTSNGMKVDQNFDLAEKAYSHAKANGGQMPTNIGTGTAAQAINNGLALYNEMLAKHGFEVLERFMTTKQTVKQIEQFTGFKVSGENLSTEVYGAAILGPKIGNGFFANLYGHFEQLTIDRWLMRTWGRWTGTLIEENPGQVKAKREQLRALITSLSPEDKKAFESIIGSRLKLSALDEVAAAIQKASIKPANRVKMATIGLASDEAGQARLAEILGPLKKGQVRGSFGDELRKAGNGLSNYLDGQKEVPSGPPERANIRKVFARTLDELRDEYPALTMSDLQALLWYPEKRLYDSAKSAEEGATSYEDDEAPDYANAAAKLARGKGVSEDDIARTIKEVDDELQAADGAGSAGRADRGSAQSQGAVAALAQEGATGRATLDDFNPERIGDILQRDDWSILTAENPMGQKLSDEENTALMEQLKADLDARGYQYLPAVGKYGNVENSLVIVGIPEEDAVALGAKYNQDSVLTRRGLIYPRDNSVTPVTGKVTVFDQAPEDFYTEIPGTGAKFAIDLNWGEQTADEGVLNQPAYHGSPFRGIDRFSTQHIGKGEGAQAYGWGLYFASNKDIAEFYRKKLAEQHANDDHDYFNASMNLTLEAEARGAFKDAQPDQWSDEDLLNWARANMPDAPQTRAFEEQYKKAVGQLYAVEVPDDSDLLDYDAKFNDQPEKVRKALEEMGFQPSYYVVVNENMTTVAGGREFATLADAQRYIRQNNVSGMPLERKNRVTGRDVYSALARRLGSDEAASKALAAVGIPGLRYLDANSRGARADTKSHNYVIFTDDAVQKTGELYQGPRGTFNPSTLTTSLLESADLSTFLHETGHFFLTVMADIAAQPNAPAGIAEDMATVLKWFGVKDLETWNSMSLEQQRKHHERFAESFEQYLLEGKAPSTELQQLFHRFRAWLTNVYRSLREFMVGRNLDLNDEVRAVFDRLLASESQIKQAEMLRGYEPLFKSAAEAGMTPQEWAAYQAQGQEATDQAIDQQQSRSLRDMRWATNARNKMLKALQKDAAGKRKAVEAEVAAEVAKEPIYQAMRWLRKGEMTSEDGEEIKAEKGFRLSTEALAEMYPDGALDNPDLQRLKGMTAANGLHPDVVAGMFGFSSGDQLVRALADAEPMSSVVEGLTDSRMLERFGDLATEQGIQRAADEAIHNEARGRFVATELATLQAAMGGRQETGRTDKKGRPITSNVMVKAAKQFAENIVNRRKVRDLKVGPHTAAETRAAKNAEKALRKGDTQLAITAKRDQLLNHYAARATTDALDEVDRALTYLKKFERDATRKKLDADYLDQIDKLLERVELRQRTLRELDKRARLADWIREQEDLGIEPTIPDYVREDAQLTNYKELTLEEFRGLVDTVKQIEHLGRLKNKLLTAKDQREFEAIRDSIAQSIVDNAGKRSANTRTPTTLAGKSLAAVKAFGAAHIKAATLARVMDGNKDGGLMWEYFVRSANERGDQETAMRAEATLKLAEIIEPWLKGGKPNQKKFFATLNRSLTRQEALVIALNTGNEGNLQRLLGGEGWTADQLKPVLESLSAQDWKVVQNIWDHFESYRPLIAEKEKRVFGKEPEWVEPSPFEVTTADGKTVQVKGGYYPIKYDPAASVRAEEHADAEGAKRLLKGAYGAATTRRSFTKSRAEEVSGRPLLYDLSGVYSGVNDVIHDLAWHEWLIDVNRLLKSNAIDSAMRNAYGPDAVRQFKSWRDAIAEGDQASTDAIDIAIGRLRQSVSVAGLGFNVMSALMQPLGFTQSVVRVGPAHVGRGILQYIGKPVEATRGVNEKSTFMRNRSRTRFRELNEIRNRVQGQTFFQRVIAQHAYTLMLRVQQMVDVPTWLGAYEKAIAAGNDETRAIALADQAVIDSQGGGQTKDLAAIERGGQAAKLFTVFYSFMNTTANLAVASKMGPDSKAKFAANMLLLTVVPAVLGSMLKDVLTPGDAGDDDMEKLAKKLAGEQLSYLLGLVVVGREFGEATKMAFGLADRPRDYAGPAGLRAIADAYKFAKQAGQGEFDDSFRKAAVNLAGDLMGLPAAQINRTITGTKALVEGETQNPAAVVLGYQKP